MKKAEGIQILVNKYGYTPEDAENEIDWFINERQQNKRAIEIGAIKEAVAKGEEE